jgi:hypothetical protein
MFLLPGDKLNVVPDCPGVYALVQARTGRVYVGRSANIRKRIRDHRYYSKPDNNLRQYTCSYLYRAWRKDAGDWYAYVLECCSPEDSLAEREVYWINYFQSSVPGLGFNLAAPTPEVHMSPELRQRMSDSRRGVPLGPMSAEHKAAIAAAKLGVPVPKLRGRPRPEHLRAAQAARYKGRPVAPSTPESLARLSAALLGKPKSAEHSANISAGKKGRPNLKLRGTHRSAETKAKISAARAGITLGPMSEEQKRNIADKLKGITRSPETRAKMSAAAKLRCEKIRLAKQQEISQDTAT